MIENNLANSSPSNDKISICKGNLIFVQRQKIQSFKFSHYFLKEHDTEFVTIDKTELKTLHDS